jgi:hypothetical protein
VSGDPLSYDSGSMSGRSRLLGVVVLLGLLLHAAAAYGAPGDPAPGSPSGSVYELPLAQGRSDAAPANDNGGERGGGGASAGNGESFYRSENNFGSSAQVPGDPRTMAGGGSDVKKGSGGGQGSDDGGSKGSPSALGSAAAVRTVDTGNTSPAISFALLGAIALVALGVGFVVARTRRVSS